MSNVLAVVSPPIRGKHVTRLQRLLDGGNVFGGDYLQGPVDGEFGPETARACYRAKYWFGYPEGKLQPVAGDFLLDLLSGKVELPKEYKARRTRRLKAAKTKPLRLKALARAERNLGMKENPRGSNWCPISRRWGVKGPWCAMSVSVWYIDVGSRAFILHRDFAYVPFMLQAAERGEHNLAIVRASHALPGDIVCFDWDDDGVPDHTGLLRTRVTSSFMSIEGNTSSDEHGDQSNGGEVCHKRRSLLDVATHNRAPAFVRVGR